MSRGDPDLVGEVDVLLVPSSVMLAGLDDWTPVQDEVIGRLGLRRAGSAALADTSAPVLDWIARGRVARVAVHFDVDVLDPKSFGPVLSNRPGAPPDFLPGVPRGRMASEQVVRLLRDVAAACDLVGLAVAEYLPLEAIATSNLLRQLPLPGG